jgi:hypothetical protein
MLWTRTRGRDYICSILVVVVLLPLLLGGGMDVLHSGTLLSRC